MQVKQFYVQSVHTEETDTYPEGQVDRHEWSGFKEKVEVQERQ